MTGDDDDLWREVAGSVTPLAGKTLPAKTSSQRQKKTATATATPPPSRSVARKESPVEARPRRLEVANLDGESYGGISAADARRLKSGDTAITGKLDLHGMTLPDARSAFIGFIRAHAGSRARTVLVITGKGRDGRGVIREHLPRWCSESAHHVIAFCKALPRDGGAGAFYLRLRVRQLP